MNLVIYALFPSIFLLAFFHLDLGIIPRFGTWLPEILSLFVCGIIALRVAMYKKLSLEVHYIYLLVLYLVIIATGIALNPVSKVEVMSGLRTHLKYFPFFLLPAVYDFKEEEIKKQFLLLCGLLLLQCPVGVAQKIYYGVLNHFYSGDFVQGTRLYSGSLSIIMVSSVAVLLALFLRKRISKRAFLITSFVLLLPTTINETKVTIFILPMALFLPLFFSNEVHYWAKVKKAAPIVMLGVLFAAIYVPIYEITIKPMNSPGLYEFFFEGKYLENYFYKGAAGRIGEDIRRGDAIGLALKELSKEVDELAFGQGVGTVNLSYFDEAGGLSTSFSKKSRLGGDMLTVTQLLWEVGMAGLFVYVVLLAFIFSDAYQLSQSDDLFGAFAMGWATVVAIMSACLLYQNSMHHNTINYLFWYLSGLVAAKAYRRRASVSSLKVLARRSGFLGSPRFAGMRIRDSHGLR